MCICGHSITEHDFLGCKECKACSQFRPHRPRIEQPDRIEKVFFFLALAFGATLYLYFLAGVFGWIH